MKIIRFLDSRCLKALEPSNPEILESLRENHLVESARKKTGLGAVIVCCVLLWAIAGSMPYGCGRKAMPEPPRGEKPPAVNDLSYRLVNNTIELTWTVPAAAAGKDKTPISGFLIYEFKQPMMASECPNCPKYFEKIGDVPLQGSPGAEDGLRTMVFVQPIEAGYRHIYKVATVNEAGMFSRDSNEIELSY